MELLHGDITDHPAIDNPTPARAYLRHTHPNLYWLLMTFGLIDVALGVNFLATTPTFQQYDIDKTYIGVGFLTLGLAKLVFLNVYRNLNAVRVVLILSIFYMILWGIGTTQTAFEGTSSFQLCILYFGLAALRVWVLREPFFNPATANGNGNGATEGK